MNNSIKKTICLIMLITFLFCSVMPVSAYYADASQIQITLTPGSSTMNVNGELSRIVKPRYNGSKVLYVPLRPVMEAFGAEVTWKEGKKVVVAFRDVSAELTVQKTAYSANQIVKKLEAAPVIADGSLMVPVSFITANFGIREQKSGTTVNLILPDDGALSDLSFLTGGISKTYIGNSYYGWEVSVPKGSSISSLSFNSGYILVENAARQIGLEVSVLGADGKTIQELYETISEDPTKYFDGDVLDSALVEKSSQPYAQFLYTNSSDQAALSRVFVKGNSVIAMILTAYNEADPEKIINDAALKSVMDSFKTEYPASSANIQDVSKIKYGFAKYENYISSDSGKKYFTWEMNIIPSWNELIQYSDQYYQEIGTDQKEYVSVEICDPSKDSGAEAYRNQIIQQYETNFSEKAYSLIGKESLNISGEKAYGLDFSLKVGDSTYIYNEWFISVSGLVYDITFKCQEESYKDRKQDFTKMFQTFKIYTKDSADLVKDVDKYQFAQSKNRIGKDDSYTLYENKQFCWSASLPGRWLKTNNNNANIDYFYNSLSYSRISVESIEAAAAPKDVPDEEKFDTLSGIVNQYGASEISKSNIQLNNMPCTHLVYRIEDEENENYSNINVYIVTSGKYSYCIIDIIPDITATDNNLQELGKIVSSFAVKAETK